LRRNRVWIPGASYHIMSRGNRKFPIFYEDSDYRKYLSIFEEVREHSPFVLHSYCLMPNHIHLIMETSTVHITEIMQPIQTSYAIYFNKKYDLVGHVFQGRFKSKLIDSRDYFLTAGRYIHLNPLESNLIDDPSKYPWSSYQYYVNGNPPSFLDTSRTISLFPGPKSYQFFVERTSTPPESKLKP
jgi:putative transposase